MRRKIKDIISYPVCSGITPKAGGDDYTESKEGFAFIRAFNLIDSQVNLENIIYVKSHIHNHVLKRTQLKKGDVLFSIAGTVGRCAIFSHEIEANINQAVAIIRTSENILKRLYITLFFNSKIGKIYTSKYGRQGLQTNLNLDEVSNLEIPIISMKQQSQIVKLLEMSFYKKEQSQQLLHIAKTAVEKAIETDEQTAINWSRAEQLKIQGENHATNN